MRIVIPQVDERERCEGVSRIIRVLKPVFGSERSVVLDFSQCRFISALGVAILAGAKFWRDQQGLDTLVDTDTLNGAVFQFLKNIRFLTLFGHQPPPWTSTSLPVLRQTQLVEQEIIEYVDNQILQRTEMPEMSKSLEKWIRRAFFELFGNVFHHSESPIGGVVCGQVYPRVRTIQIVLYDVGVGVARRVRPAVPGIVSDTHAITWALRRGTSTSSTDSQARGLGLYVLREFLRVNEGDFCIYANKGAIEEVAGKRSTPDVRDELRGTLIDMRINVRNDVTYTLSLEEE